MIRSADVPFNKRFVMVNAFKGENCGERFLNIRLFRERRSSFSEGRIDRTMIY